MTPITSKTVPGSRECSVVIPTSGRRSLAKAVASALWQHDMTVEVIISPTHELAQDLRETVLGISPSVRILPVNAGTANEARQRGVVAAAYSIVAFLDDDDYWVPGKLTAQLDSIDRAGLEPTRDLFVASCNLLMLEDGRRASVWTQCEGMLPGPREYLFSPLRGPKSARHQLQTSTLVFPTRLALEVPLPGDMQVHQEWGWLLKLEKHFGAEVSFVGSKSTFVVYNRDTRGGGISSSTRSRQSLEWARDNLLDRNAPARARYGSFLVRVSARFAALSGNVGDVCRLALQAWREGQLGWWEILTALRFVLVAMRNRWTRMA